MLRVLMVVVALLLAGCGTEAGPSRPADAMPADFAGEISYSNGSLPPPYHYEWRVEFDTVSARLTWTPGYDGAEEWSETVDLGPAERRQLYDRIEETGLFEFENSDDGMVGGPTGRATFRHHDTGTLGTSEAGQDMLDELVDATRATFPDAVWTEMESKQRAWEEQHPQ
jgi:hypothetical protein